MIGLKSTTHATPTPNSQILVFVKFGLVGATTAAIYFLVMWLADEIVRFPYIVAVSLAYAVSTVFHFLANRKFTFTAVQGFHGSQIPRYLLVWFVYHVITIMLVNFCVERVRFSPYIGVCVSVLFTVSVGYVLGRYWVFKVTGETV